MNRLTVCTSCKASRRNYSPDRFVEELEGALDQAGLADRFTVRPFECMGVCADPVTVALQGEEMATYVFAGVDPEKDVTDIIATCRVYVESPLGWIEDARPCGRLRHCLKARVPALTAPD